MESSSDNNNNNDDRNHDRPNRGPPKKGFYSASSSSNKKSKRVVGSGDSTCSDSSLATGIETQLSSVQEPQLQQQEQPIDQQQQIQQQQDLLNQTQLLFGISVSSFGFFLFFYLPFAAFMALMVFFSSTSLASYFLYLYMAEEFRHRIRTRGFGDLLPASVYQQLTEMSLHEWLQDSRTVMQYRHLLLYFVPGMTPEQLERYVDRLPERHRRNLRRPGLGHFLGDNFLQLIMGEDRFRQQQMQMIQLQSSPTPSPPSSLMLLQSSQSRSLPAFSDVLSVHEEGEEEVDADNNNDNDDGSFVDVVEITTTPREFALRSRSLARSLLPPPPPVFEHTTRRNNSRVRNHDEGGDDDDEDDDDDEAQRQRQQRQQQQQRELEEQETILNEAFASMSNYLATTAVSRVTSFSARIVENYLSPVLIRSGLGLTSLSLTLGVAGAWAGVYSPSPSLFSRGVSPGTGNHPFSNFMPSSRTLTSSALVGGTSAAAMFLVRAGFRRAIRSERGQIENANLNEKDSSSSRRTKGSRGRNKEKKL